MKNPHISDTTWDDIKDTLLTPEEQMECDFQLYIITELIKARQKKGFTQRKLAKITGVQQPVIARIEAGHCLPSLSTLRKLFVPLGKKIKVVSV